MPKEKTQTPKLYKRGKNGNWCFRRFINGKDKVINTKTTVKSEAEKFVKKYISLENEAQNKINRRELAIHTAQAIMLTVSGQEIERFTFEEGFQIYLDTTEDFMDLSKRYRDSFTSTCKKFFKWCREHNLKYLDEVTNEIARNYAKHLLENNFTTKTFDDYIKILSKFFTTVDAMKNLPNRNPFNKVNVRRKQKGVISEASRRALEPDMIRAVMEVAAQAGEDMFDLFTVGLYTGMRLKDAALLQWDSVGEQFISIIPYKTIRFNTVSKIPITGQLVDMLKRRAKRDGFNRYVNPTIAELYLKDDGYYVCKKSQEIFVKALGKENTIVPKSAHRKVNSSIYSFESFRTTFVTLLGENNTDYRTVMEMLGWSSWNMLKVYEKKYQFNSQSKDLEKIRSVEKLDVLTESVSEISPELPQIKPTQQDLDKLLLKYSNITIGKIYNMSEAAIRKWLNKFGLERTKRIESSELTDDEIQRIRQELQAA